MADEEHTLAPDTSRRMVRAILKSERAAGDRRGRRPRWPAAVRVGVLRLLFVSMQDDSITCKTADDEEEFVIAKPYQLRRSPFDGETYNGVSYTYSTPAAREAVQGEDSEDQVIVPAYVAGDELFAIQADTGVEVDGETVDWLDLNIDARAWAKTAE